MICFRYFCQKRFFFILSVVHNDPFSMQLESKKTILKRFYPAFFRTAGFQHNLIKLSVSSNIFHWKSVKESKVGVTFGTKIEPN